MTKKTFVIGHKVWYEISISSTNLQEVNQENKKFYESCIGYFKRKIQKIDQFSVIGLMIGAWVAIHQFYEQFRHQQ